MPDTMRVESCDLLVVGSGGGALTGAYAAAREGLDVRVVESTDRFGGTTAYSGGGMWFPDSAVLRRTGASDDLEIARAYYHAVVGDDTPRALQNAFVETGRALIDYLETDPYLKFQLFPWPDYFGSVPGASPEGYRHVIPLELEASELGDALRAKLRPTLPLEHEDPSAIVPKDTLLTGGQALIGRLLLALRQYDNARLELNSPLVALIAKDGRVEGAVIESLGVRRTIMARRGVLLAAGGFERNDAMRSQFGLRSPAAWSMGAPGSQGQAHRAAMEIGADTGMMGEGWWSPGLLNPDGSSWFFVGVDHGIMVDRQGRRFANEVAPYDRLGREMLANHGDQDDLPRFWLIFDDRGGGALPIMSTTLPIEDPQAYRAAGLWHSAPDLETLAERIGVPADALQASVARFNAFSEAGHDADFGRGEEAYDRFFAQGADARSVLPPVDVAPFHAGALGISDLGTKGGLVTNVDGQVLNRDGQPIGGLYAAGNTMAAVSGRAYPGGGNPIGSSMVFAYRAVRDLIG